MHAGFVRPDGNYVVKVMQMGERRSSPAYYILSPGQWHEYLTDDITHHLIGVGLRRTRKLREAMSLLPR
jgi:hypothetical protein